MKNILSFFIAITLFSCTSITKPTGNAEKDGVTFVKEFKKAYEVKDVEKARTLIDTYYDFYKQQNPIDINIFFDTTKDNGFGLVDEDISNFINQSDKYGKMDKLYKQSRNL